MKQIHGREVRQKLWLQLTCLSIACILTGQEKKTKKKNIHTFNTTWKTYLLHCCWCSPVNCSSDVSGPISDNSSVFSNNERQGDTFQTQSDVKWNCEQSLFLLTDTGHQSPPGTSHQLSAFCWFLLLGCKTEKQEITAALQLSGAHYLLYYCKNCPQRLHELLKGFKAPCARLTAAAANNCWLVFALEVIYKGGQYSTVSETDSKQQCSCLCFLLLLFLQWSCVTQRINSYWFFWQ